MQLEAASLSHVGRVRERNEDATGHLHPADPSLRDAKGSLFVVADGMGGHSGGETASRLAVETVIARYYAAEGDPPRALDEAFREANRVVREKARTVRSLHGMGTTCTALVLRKAEAFVAHVGDSRAYLLRGNDLVRLTEDHSLVWEMVRRGILTERAAMTHPRRNVITRSIGASEDLSVDVSPAPIPVRDGDVFLLCSDGLTSLVGEPNFVAALQAGTAREACERLVGLANEGGGKDNVTVVVIRARDDG